MLENRLAAVLVTGAAGGIGRELVRQLADAGTRVVAIDRSARRLDALAREMVEAGAGNPRTIVADVTNEAAAAAAVAEGAQWAGGPFGLANIAGGIVGSPDEFYDKPLEAMAVEEWEEIFRLNTLSAMLMCKAAIPPMRDHAYGKIVSVASMAYHGTISGMGNVAYDSAKAAVVAMTRSLARSLGPSGIRINGVAPGLTATAGLQRFVKPEFIDAHARRTPVGHIGAPEDVASAMRFLLASASDHVTGEIIEVAGGLR